METLRHTTKRKETEDTDRRTVPRIFFRHCWGTFFLSFKTSTPEQRRKLSMSRWTVLNNKMSPLRKLYRFWVLAILLFLKLVRPFSQLRVLCICVEPLSVVSKKLLRRIELLQKKGYQIQVEIWLQEKDIEEYPSEFGRVLDLPVELIVRLI